MKLNSRKGFVWIIPILVIGAVALSAVLGGLIGEKMGTQNVQTPIPEKTVGSALPQSAPSVFETYLSSQQGTGDTTMTLASGSLRDGTSLTGYQCFTVDSNSPSLEYECGTASGGTVTGLVRGIDAVSGTTSVASLIFSHRLGADVKITDYPSLTYLIRMANGSDTYDQPIFYNSSISTSTLAANRNSFASAGLVADTAFSAAGITNASTAARGIVQIGTTLQAASSTGACSSGSLCVIPTSSATSTFNSATAPLRVVVTKNNGKIDDNFISTSSLFSNMNLTNGTTTISATSTVDYLGQQPLWTLLASSTVSTPTASITLSVPARQKLMAFINMSGTLAAGTLSFYFNGDQSQCCTRSYSWATSTGSGSDSSLLPLATVSNPNGTATTSVVLNISTWLGAGGSKTFVEYSGTYLAGVPFSLVDFGGVTAFTGSGVWSTTTPQQVNQITFVPSSGNIAASSSVYIYGSAF